MVQKIGNKSFKKAPDAIIASGAFLILVFIENICLADLQKLDHV